jgi:hypothetical protein
MVCEFMMTPLQAELATAALDFLRGGLRILRRGGGEAECSASGTCGWRGQFVVARGASALAVAASNTCTPGEVSDQHLHVDAARSPCRRCARAEVLQALDDETRALARAVEIEAPQALEAGSS